MDDSISRQAAIDAMMALQKEDVEAYGCHIPECFDGERAAEALKQLPTADVVEVVRCRDCKYWKELLPVCERIHRAGWGVNDFCSFGERKES